MSSMNNCDSIDIDAQQILTEGANRLLKKTSNKNLEDEKSPGYDKIIAEIIKVSGENRCKSQSSTMQENWK